MRRLAFLALLALAACGAEGDPFRPTTSLGVGIDSDGDVGVGGSFGVTNGTLSLGVGL
jgi:hypothetical protein